MSGAIIIILFFCYSFSSGWWNVWIEAKNLIKIILHEMSWHEIRLGKLERKSFHDMKKQYTSIFLLWMPNQGSARYFLFLFLFHRVQNVNVSKIFPIIFECPLRYHYISLIIRDVTLYTLLHTWDFTLFLSVHPI